MRADKLLVKCRASTRHRQGRDQDVQPTARRRRASSARILHLRPLPLYLPGAIALWAALLFALAAVWGYAELLRGNEESRLFARRSYRFFVAAIVFAAVVLMVCLARRDFRIEYVHQYSGTDLPWYYQLGPSGPGGRAAS
jgi:hypothetical protein